MTTNEELAKEALDLAISFRDYEPGQQDEVMERGWDETADLLDRLADALELADTIIAEALAVNAAPHANTKQSNSRMTAVESVLARWNPAVS